MAGLAAPAAFLRAAGLTSTDEAARLKDWDLLKLPIDRRSYIRLGADDGSFGIAPVRGDAAKVQAELRQAVGVNLAAPGHLTLLPYWRALSHETRLALDVGGWDLRARRADKPLHALLGTKRTVVRRYSDVRGKTEGFQPQAYADTVAQHLRQSGHTAVKLHFSGALGDVRSLGEATIMETLERVREAVGPEVVLAWDPHPAESATRDPEAARSFLRHMQALDYAWLEGPVPPGPFETQAEAYRELMAFSDVRLQPEGPGDNAGDGTRLPTARRWIQAKALDQISTDTYILGSLTETLAIAELARAHGVTINLHWSWLPHAHLAMAYTDAEFPLLEWPYQGEIPAEYVQGDRLKAPDWPGIYPLGE